MQDEPVPASRKKALGKGLELMISDEEVESLGLVEGNTLTDDANSVDSGRQKNTLVDNVIKDPDRLEIDWTKEKNVPIHELVIKNKKKKK